LNHLKEVIKESVFKSLMSKKLKKFKSKKLILDKIFNNNNDNDIDI
jgi:hypothetical protein